MHPNQTKHDKAHREKMKAAGFRSVRVWVHDQDREKLLAYATRMRKRRENTHD